MTQRGQGIQNRVDLRPAPRRRRARSPRCAAARGRRLARFAQHARRLVSRVFRVRTRRRRASMAICAGSRRASKSWISSRSRSRACPATRSAADRTPAAAASGRSRALRGMRPLANRRRADPPRPVRCPGGSSPLPLPRRAAAARLALARVCQARPAIGCCGRSSR